MRIAFINIIISTLLGTVGVAQGLLAPQIVEKTLGNGIKILAIEQPGSGVVHAHIFLKVGRSSSGQLPPIATDLLARTIFRRALPNNFDTKLINTLESDANIFTKLKSEQAKINCQPSTTTCTKLSTITSNISNTAESTAVTRLIDTINESEIWDELDSIGASNRSLIVTADYCSYGLDLPKDAVQAWSQIESNRLGILPLFRFPFERDRLILEIAADTYPNSNPNSKHLYTLLTTTLPGKLYTTKSNIDKSHAELITANDIKSYASYAASPENIILILIGDIDAGAIMPQMDHTFGMLQNISSGQTQWISRPSIEVNNPKDTIESLGNRRLTISTNNDARIFFSWHVPPINDQDRLILMTLVKALSNRCNDYLADSRNIAYKLEAQLGVPGQRDTNLLVIEAEPKDWHCLSELEYGIKYEVARLQQEPLSSQELHKLQAKIKLDELVVQEDAKAFAETIGSCMCQGDNWRLAFSTLEDARSLTSTELQLAAQTFLASHRMTTISLTPNLVYLTMNLTEERILEIFKKLLEQRSGSKVKTQKILGETLRQLHMLSPEDQLQILKLLEHKVSL